MELTPLRQFVELARTGHMTRAATALGVTQPALSAMLKKLEAELGAPLMLRVGRRLELTDAGRAFHEHARSVVLGADRAAQAVREVMGLEHGSIRIGGGATAITYLLPPVISAVRAKHPGLRFYLREAGSATVAAAVIEGELDLGIVTLPVKSAQADALVRVPLVEDELRLIMPAGGRGGIGRDGSASAIASDGPDRRSAGVGRGGARARGFAWKDLEGVPIVAFEHGTAVREVIDRASQAAGVALDVVMELRSIESIKQMVAAGIGVGFVSRFALDEGEGLPCRERRLTRQLAIVRRRGRPLSAAAEAFERALVEAARR